MVYRHSKDTIGEVVLEGLGQDRPVVIVQETRVYRGIEDGIGAERCNVGWLVYDGHPDCIRTDCAGGNILVSSCAQNIIKTAHQIGDGYITRVVLDLG